MLCECSCGQPCPFGKTGMAYRCTMADVAARLGCPIEDAPAALGRWQEDELGRMDREDGPRRDDLPSVRTDGFQFQILCSP
jgi:hypothetical protein